MSNNTNPNPDCADSAPAPLDLDALAGHTPGPWSIAPCSLFRGDSAASKGQLYGMDVVTGTEPPTWDNYADQGEGEWRYPEGAERVCSTSDANGAANAALIAAAPALLAELRAERASCEVLRAEIARLRAVVKSLAWCDPYPDDAGDAESTLNDLIEAARVALSESREAAQ